MSKIIITEYKSPVGELLIGSIDEQLCLCDWQNRKARSRVDKRISNGLKAEFIFAKSEFNKQVINQLEAYFAKELSEFSLPLKLVGTDFQQKVWQALMTIPFANTQSYGQLAQSMNMPSAVRAVANANGANAISIIVPCHRIIGSNGKLTGYAGGLDAKQRLLEIEGLI
ncbi:methylated-DNA--[protein]-cysteine S-methyltransferase [Pseudoalteromonas sp. SSM20]|uniref:methylated-DNA--[protein]-cysteine S-methyltransferase n=1 Tax=unclassified Pseudoalteromonas TaxID=194690 RepID=UPI00237EC7F3|nr:methylated-DNA--[protein]-cysteine S-methyltransferase [Pseudoalteromonas sp. G4]MDE3273988.1 methylated-DNA--[protein]-cysteine S-methyltransferase [Pseudoalteromonas sp. G4]